MAHLEAEKDAELKILNKWKNVVKEKQDKREKGYRREAAPVKNVDSKKAVSKASNKWLKPASKEGGGGASSNGKKTVNPTSAKAQTSFNRAAMKGKSASALSSSGKAGPSGVVKAPTTDKSSARGFVKSNSSAAANRSQSACLKSKSAPAIGRPGYASVKKPYVPHRPAPKAGNSGMGGKMDPKKGGGGGKHAPKMGGKMGGKFQF